jgi:murein L,D-transpeptidase YafK
MIVKKAFTYSLLAAITFVPWNATAVNRFSLSNLLPKYDFVKNSFNKATLGSLADVSNIAGSLAENLLIKSLLEISQGQTQQALNTIDQLIAAVPNFKLAYLVRGDLLMAQGKHLLAFGGAHNLPNDAVKDLQEEARVRIERYLAEKIQEKQPNLLLAPSASQKHLIVVDTGRSRLFLYQNQGDKLQYLADYYITVGKNGVIKQSEGDKRTPIGVYFARGRLNQSLPDFYGEGAYPLNYPNEWDKQNNRKGSGIWLHGTSRDTFSRPPRASDGCVVLANEDLKTLAPVLQSGRTPVIIVNQLEWLEPSNQPHQLKLVLNHHLDTWLKDWRTQDTEKYLAHYSKNFSSNGLNYQNWAEHKKRVQAGKPQVEISVSDVSMYSYPDSDKKLVVVDFVQDYKSPVLKNRMQKRQYWIQEPEGWKIIYEGAA